MGLGQMFSVNPSFAAARVSGYALQKVIDRVPKIDSNPNGLKTPIYGRVTFRNVRFTYSVRPTGSKTNKQSKRFWKNLQDLVLF
jgi:hypothetical protein